MEIDSAITQPVIEQAQPAEAQPSRNLAVFGLVGLSAMFLVSVLLTLPGGDYFTICGFKTFTGLPCPGCGLTHSFCALGKGEVAGAFGFNLLGPPLFFTLVVLWIRSAGVLLNKSDFVQWLDGIARRLNVVRAFAFGFVVYGIARIAYLLAFHPVSCNDSPLSHLIARLFR
ncbi:MAG: DUF2752 domain-containing protein [Acidobacteriota bacterium]